MYALAFQPGTVLAASRSCCTSRIGGAPKTQNGQQSGDPNKLAQALIMIAGQEQPPLRFIAGADAIAIAEQKVATLQAQIDAYRELSTSLALDNA